MALHVASGFAGRNALIILRHRLMKAVFGPFNPRPEARRDEPRRHERDREGHRRQND